MDARLHMTRGLRFNIAMMFAMIAVSVGWALVSGFALPPLDFFLLQALVTGVFGSAALIYLFLRPDPQIARLMVNIVVGFWFVGFCILFSYLCATIDRPLVDADLAAADQALGIDWPALVTWASTKPLIVGWARFIYDRPFSEPLVILVLLAVLRRPDRVEELVSCIMISAVITATLGA